MRRRMCCYWVMGIVMALCGQSICTAQAFYPLLRTDSASDAAEIGWTVYAYAYDSSYDPFMTDTDSSDSTAEDVNLTTEAESADAEIGDADAGSTSLPEAEIIPNSGSSASVAECIVALDGTWSCVEGNDYCVALITNTQSATAEATFQVQGNATYPDDTSGTLNITFNLSVMTLSTWSSGTVSASCGESNVSMLFSQDGYAISGNIGGSDLYEDGDGDPPTWTYTDTKSVSVGDSFTMSAYASAGTGDSVRLNGVGGISLTTSCFVSNP